MTSQADDGPQELHSANFSDNFRFTIPPPLRPHLCMDYDEGNPTAASVFWYYETTHNVPVLANNPLTQANFASADRVTYGVKDNWRIQIPEGMRKQCRLVNPDGTPVTDTIYILAFGDMLLNDPKSAFILTEPQAWDLLPTDGTDSINHTFADQVLAHAPGFLSTPE